MRYARIGLAVVLCLAAPTATGLLRAQPQPDSPGLWNAPLPEPPRQKAEWTPPNTELPDALVTATAELFRQGLADPRGCEYRAIVLPFEKVANPQAQGAPPARPATHGWVLPNHAAADSPRFAVCWNGLVYPVLEVGEPADLDADVKAIVDQIALSRATAERENRPFYLPFGDPYPAVSEFQTVHQTSLDPAKVVILLRLGRADLAQALWSAATGWTPGAAEGSAPGLATRDPYLAIAFDWAWQLLERATSAHARGDDARALDNCRRLKTLEPAIEATFRERERRYAQVEDNRLTVPMAFLRPLSSLLADQERRARPRPARGDSPPAESARAQRIDTRIRGLEEVGREPMDPALLTGLGPAPVAVLVGDGDAAVPALLDCLEFDDRLTRNVVHDDRRRSRYLHVQAVYAVAFEALAEILGTREFGRHGNQAGPNDASRAARHALAADVRSYWAKNRGKSPQERLFGTLADDQATPEQWLDASIRLTRQADVSGTRYSHVTPPRTGGVVPPPFGEPLRGKTKPSLSELLARRVNWLDPGAETPLPDGQGKIYAVFKANDVALDLARWDIEAALPTLSERVARCAAIVLAEEGRPSRFERLETDIAAFTLLRHQGGDPGALDDYAAWVITLTPEGWSFFPISLFEPLWRFSDVPAMARAAEALFANERSPWVPLFQPRQRGWSELGQRDDMICSPLLGVAPFRALVLKGLADDRVSSTVTAIADGSVEIRVDDGWATRPTPFPDEPRIAPGSTGTLRLKDLYAWKLSHVPGFPRFELYWPEPERNAAITRCIEFLDRYADRLTAGARRWRTEELPTWHRHDRATLVFEPLGHPATEADVHSGRAIFALPADDPDTVRTAELPQVPLAAEWLNSRGGPVWNNTVDASGKARSILQYTRAGQVWQAEERRKDSGWRRTYGFVGANTLQGVPAEEIRFPGDWREGWNALSDTLDVRLTLPGTLPAGLPRARVGDPLPLTLAFRNPRGVDVSIPSDLGHGGARPALREGVSVRLFRRRATRPERPPVELELEPRPLERERSGSSRMLTPADHVAALELDLRDLFAIEEPGIYRVVIELEGLPADSGLPPKATVEAGFTID